MKTFILVALCISMTVAASVEKKKRSVSSDVLEELFKEVELKHKKAVDEKEPEKKATAIDEFRRLLSQMYKEENKRADENALDCGRKGFKCGSKNGACCKDLACELPFKTLAVGNCVDCIAEDYRCHKDSVYAKAEKCCPGLKCAEAFGFYTGCVPE